MKTCTCGGMLYRHGKATKKAGSIGGDRYRCKDCGKCITVRNGEITYRKPGRPMVNDWRMNGNG